MDKIFKHILAVILLTCSILTAVAGADVVSSTRFRIEKLSTPTITINGKTLKKGDTFNAGDKIEWTSPDQSMVVKDVKTSQLMRFSKRVLNKKGAVNSILDFYIQVNKGSSRGGNWYINLTRSDNAGDFPEKRIALVVGNQNYQYLAPLKSAQKDAEDISSTLAGLGFDVIEMYETNYSDLMAGVNKFSGLAKDYDVALVYYAGHGIQEDNINYLVPVDNMLERRADLRDCVSCNEIVEKVEESRCPSKIFYFDACRDRKTTWSRSALNGLSAMEGSAGTVIVFATQSGKVASDGERDGNSPFAQMLIKNIQQPALTFSEMMTALVRDTYNATNRQQSPVTSGNLIADFRFNPAKPVADFPITSVTETQDDNSPYRTPIYKEAKRLENEGKYAEAMQMYLKEKDNPYCQNNIGCLYLNGEGVAIDYKKAYDWFLKAAKQGYGLAMANLGRLHGVGNGVPKNYNKAYEWFQKSANAGDATGTWLLGVMYITGEGVKQDTAKGLDLLKQGAESEPEYMVQTAKFFSDRYGYGLPADYSEYFKWMEKAAEAGNEEAMYLLGTDYLNGLSGLPRNVVKAYNWISKAAEKGYIDAEIALGEMYMGGILGEVNYNEAEKWYLKAADKGSAAAEYDLGYMYRSKKTESSDEYRQNREKAKRWLHKAAEKGFTRAKTELGTMYYWSQEDVQRGLELLETAAAEGDLEAYCQLGEVYATGRYIVGDPKKAFDYYKKAADAGYVRAMYTVGWNYYYGNGVPVNKALAKSWMQKAADAGDNNARVFLMDSKL